jgi:hypothetical protein
MLLILDKRKVPAAPAQEVVRKAEHRLWLWRMRLQGGLL